MTSPEATKAHAYVDVFQRTGDMVAIRQNGDRLSLRAMHARLNLRMPVTHSDVEFSARFFAQWASGMNSDVLPTEKPWRAPEPGTPS